MTVLSMFGRLCIAACALTTAAAAADPPARVGRITYIEGDVSFYNDPEDGWQRAQINYPVTSENSLWTEGRGRAEVRIGPSAIRISDDTSFDFVKLHDDAALGYLQRGTLNVRIRQFGNLDAADRMQIDTSEGRFILEGGGRYRIDAAAEGGESRISVFSGSARFEGASPGDARLTIDGGKQLTVRTGGGIRDGMDFRYHDANESPFDRWAENRDQQWDQTHNRYARNDSRDGFRETLISPYMTGYEELDAAGEWFDDNEYGRLWAPRMVVSGWAPYRYGRWSHVRPWGWTWIDDAPWGFAPFHYGRWVQVRSRWCWWPGPYVGRPVYAPALVAWFGDGAGLRISSGPAIGWFPLAPREYYVPRYTSNPHYLRRINDVTNNITVINPPSRYRNQVPGATVVANTVFINGRPVGSHVAHLPPGSIAGRPPVSHVDLPRPRRTPGAQMPDRRSDTRPSPEPRPRFTTETPAPRVQQPLPPGQQTPRFRTPGNAVIGPLPMHETVPEIRQGRPYPTPAPAALPPTAPPRTHPQTQVQPQPQFGQPSSGAGVVPRVAPLRVEPAPVIPDRDARPEPRPPSSRNRPQQDAPHSIVPPVAPPAAAPRAYLPSPPQQMVAPPVAAPRPYVPPQQPVAPGAAPVAPQAPQVTPAPARSPKPAPEVQEEIRNENRGRLKGQRE